MINFATFDPTADLVEIDEFPAVEPAVASPREKVVGPKLAGRAAIITGASMGFGAAIAEQFIAQGAKVLLCAREGTELARHRRILEAMYPDANVISAIADVSDKADVDFLFDFAIERFGSVQIVVNNAGVYGPMGRLDEIDWDDWKQAIDINLMGAVYSCRRAVQHFKQNGYGKIINLSGGGATNPLPGLSAYAASKAALVRFTETLAIEVRQSQIDANTLIDINSVAPGEMNTRLADQVIAAGPDAVGQMLYERTVMLKANGGTSPRLGADLCVYLASAESDGITGKLIAAKWDPWPFSEEARRDLEFSDTYTLRRVVPRESR